MDMLNECAALIDNILCYGAKMSDALWSYRISVLLEAYAFSALINAF